ncbi:hypothetical protein WJX79_009412 [Trebouxia sp. C0005]
MLSLLNVACLLDFRQRPAILQQANLPQMLLHGASSDMHSSAEVDRLQRAVELLRLKDLQQEHHIHVLTQQLRSQQAESPKLAATRPVLQSSVSAKWHEWHQRRSQSPEPFHRPLADKFQLQSNQQGNANRPVLRERRSRAKASCNSLDPGSTAAAKAASSTGRQQSYFQISAVMGSSGKLSRSRGTFGSEHRCARTHTLKSTFGSEARWWENPVAERASSPSSQQSAAASRSSPDRHGGSSAHRVSSPDRSTGQKLHSTFGEERRSWETKGHSTAAASQPQLQQPDAERLDVTVKAVAALWTPRQRSTSPDLVKPAAGSCSDGERWWQGSQEHGSLEGSLRQRRSEPVVRARTPPLPPKFHPQSMSSSVQQGLTEHLHAQPWNKTASQAEHGFDAQAETGTRSRHQSTRQSAGSLSSPAHAESPRSSSRSLSPSGFMQHISQVGRRSSSNSELQDTLRRRSVERQRLEQVRSPHVRDWAQSLRDLSTELQPSFQRSDSRKQARELQQEFLQKAKEDLEAFQQTSSRASQACDPQSRSSLEDTGITVDFDQQPEDAGDWNVHAVQERPRTTLEKRLERQLSRSSRHGAGASGQEQAWQGSSIRPSCQDSTMKPATQAAAGGAVANQAKLTAHSSLPSAHTQASVQRATSQNSLFRSVSWADHSELQEPSHDDSFEMPHETDPMVLHTPDMGSQTAVMQLVGLSHSPSVDPVVAKSHATAEYVLLSGDLQSRTAKLDAYYKAMQSPVQAAVHAAEPSSSSATFTADDAETSGLSVAQRSAMFAALEAKSGARRASTGLPHTASATATAAAGEVALGLPARRVSLVVPESMRQNKADAFSPGKPGLKSQLSKMMEEVAQARSEVQGLQSQLSVRSRLGQMSGSTASSVAGSDHFIDGV